MRRPNIILAAAGVCFTAGPLAAQTCVGAPSFADGPLAVTGALTSGNNASAVGATVRYGTARGLFFGGSVARVDYDGTTVNSTSVGANIGHELRQQVRPNIAVCPLGSLSRGFGPDFGLDETNTVTLAGGASFGVTVPIGEDVVGIPFFGASFVHLRTTTETAGIDATDTDNHLLFTGGLGFVIGRTFGVTPSVQIPFGLEGADPTFTLAIQFSFGRE